MEQDLDISKRTLIILVVLSVTISLIGTLAMLYEVSHAGVAPVVIENGGKDFGKARFAIIDQNDDKQEQESSTGMVVFHIR